MKKALGIVFLFVVFISFSPAQELLTRAEKTDYAETSLYADVMDFLYKMAARSPLIKITSLAISTEGRMIPLVIVSQEGVSQPQDMKWTGKPCVLVMANIHAGEVEGKEACLMLLREIAENKLPKILDNQVILIVPILNPDGNEKLGRNRRDNGPQLAGVRPNGQNLDLNRDYLKLDSPEIRSLVNLFHTWDPVLFVDMHTTNGSYHQHPVTYTTLVNPNTDESLRNYMWQKLFPAVAKTLKTKYGYESVPYGNFTDRLDPAKGWLNDSTEPRYGTIYVGLRNRLTILDENYSYADFKTRVLSSLGFVKSILEYTTVNIGAIRDLVKNADLATVKNFYQQPFTVEYRIEKLMDITVKSFEFVKEKIKEEDRAKYPPWIGEYLVKKTDATRDYTLPYLSKAVPVRTRTLPEGYVIMPYQAEVIAKIKSHGIRVERLLEGYSETNAQVFKIAKIELEKSIYQGHVQNKLSGDYEPRQVAVPKDAYYITMKQPLARLVAVLLEPDAEDSLASWGFFNRLIVQQWTNNPADYPVIRIFRQPPVPLIIE